MKRGVALLVALTICAMTVSVGNAAGSTSTSDEPANTAAIAPRTPAAEAAFRDVSRCLNSGQDPSLNVVYLVDLSNSIDEYELGDTLESVLVASIQQLDRFRDRGIDVAYSLIAFATGTAELVPWTIVDGTSQAETVSRALQETKLAGNTQYLAGLEAARDQFDNRSATCQMLIWMTDGAINNGGAFETVFPSLERICRPGISASGLQPSDGQFGIMQDFREKGIPVFGVFFTNERLREGLNDFERWKVDFLRPIVEGRGVVSPVESEQEGDLAGFELECAELDEGGVAVDGYANGALIESEDPIALAFEFLRLEAGLSGGSGIEIGDDGTFTIPPGTAYFRAIVGGDEWSLETPGGEMVAATDVTVVNSGGATSIEVDVDDDSFGVWTLRSDNADRTIIYLFTGLTLQLDRDLNSTVLSGAENTLTGQVIPEPGRNVTLDSRLFPEWGTVTAEIISGESESPPAGSISPTGVFEIDAFTPTPQIGEIELRVSLLLGGDFDPIESTFRLAVVDSSALAFPVQKSIELSPLEGPDGVAVGTLQIRPPENADEAQVCVVVPPDRLSDKPNAGNESPRALDTFSWSVSSDTTVDDSGCFVVERDEPVELKITAQNAQQLDSRVDTAFTVQSLTPDGVERHSEPILVGFDSRTQSNPWVVVAAIIALLILGLGIPLLLLWVLNRVTTQFAEVQSTTRATYPVRVSTTPSFQVLDRRPGSNGSALRVEPNDFIHVAQQPAGRTVDTGRGTLRARVPRFPLAASWFEWEAPPGHRVISIVGGSSKQTSEIAAHLAAEVSPLPAASWALVVSDTALTAGEPTIDAELVVFSELRSSVREYQRRVDDILLTPGLAEAVAAAGAAVRSVSSADVVSPDDPPRRPEAPTIMPTGGTPPPPPSTRSPSAPPASGRLAPPPPPPH